MSDRKITKQVILYFVVGLGDSIEGKKKLMKLMFLFGHYDFSKKKIRPRNEFGNVFYIYHYGVFSLEVMECVNELISNKKIKDGFPLKSSEQVVLKENVKELGDKVLETFGKFSGYELEVSTLKMLGINPSDKRKYFGEGIDEIIKK